MIGVVVVAHGRLADSLLEATVFIVGHRLDFTATVSVSAGQDPEELQRDLKKAVNKVDNGQGVLILVDMFGGSPSDMSISFLNPGQIEVLTGVNLPMLLHIATQRSQNPSLKELAETAQQKAIDSIALAGEMLSP